MPGPSDGQQQHHHHRSTLKQKNKSFKSRHASKGSIKTAAKGRPESIASRASSHKSSPLSAHNAAGSAQSRRNHAKQIQLQKRQALVDANRIFKTDSSISTNSSMNGGLGKGGAPRIVVVCSLTDDLNPWTALAELERNGQDDGVKPVHGRDLASVKASNGTFTEFELVRHRTTVQLHPVPYGALYALMDACKAADFVLLLLSPSTSVEAGSWGELAMRSLQAQGLPTVMAASMTLPTPAKRANEIRRSLLSFVRYFSPDTEKVYALDERNERGAMLRTLASSTPKRVAWRDFRSWLIAEESTWEPHAEQATDATQETAGLLKVTGWVRGASLSANRLVHLPDFGDFAVQRITSAATSAKSGIRDVEMQSETESLDVRDVEIADEMKSENEVNDMENEQTWPTQEEMDAAANGTDFENGNLPPALPGTTPLKVTKTDGKKRTFGANWITEEDFNDDDVMSPEDEEDARMSDSQEAFSERSSFQQNDDDDEEEDAYDDEVEARELAQYKARVAKEQQRGKEEQIDREFPDEVDTPLEIPARVRFQRYRGLRSMRTSYWDPYEDLPRDYARIFQFDNYKKTRRRVEASAMEEGVEPGVRVCLWIHNVPRAAAVRAGACHDDMAACKGEINDRVPFVVFGLLRHEHKKSVLNFTVARNTEYEATVRSKDTLILCLGPRRLRVRPIFSQHDPANDGRKGTNNVHKMERYLHGLGSQGYVAVGTVVGPVTFGGANVPAVLLRERFLDDEAGYDQSGVGATQMPHLVGTGSLLDADPTRIVAKRIVLTGHPYKIHKKTSTIRFMFFNPEDVRYFAPLELRTKLGRIGHISESLGTHGYFKAHFDGKVPLSQLDTVGMTLYKRSFPKFAETYRQSRIEMPLKTIIEEEDDDQMAM